MLRIAHIINPVKLPPQHELSIAQSISFETMCRARDFAQDKVDVQLYTTQFPEDHDILPEGFTILPDLEQSILDFARFENPRKLPLLKDILDKLYEAARDADYLIYTNVDIALMPHFYVSVAALLEEYDGLVINRRTISKEYQSIDDIALMYAQVGKEHPGHDCFIFKRDTYQYFHLENTFIGVPHADFALYINVLAFSENFTERLNDHLTFHLGDDREWNESQHDSYTAYNATQMNLVVRELRKEFGTLRPDTVLGAYLLKRYYSGRSFLKDVLAQDYSQKELIIPAHTAWSRFKRQIKIFLQRFRQR
jgi:hypothetical protein